MSIQDFAEICDLANKIGLSMSNFAQDITHKYLKVKLIEKVECFNQILQK